MARPSALSSTTDSGKEREKRRRRDMPAATTTTANITISDLSQETMNSPQLTAREVGAPSPASRAEAVSAPAPPAVASTTASIIGGRRSESSVLISDAVEEEFAAESNAEARDSHHHQPGSSSLATYACQIIIGILGLMAVISLTLMIAALADRQSFQPAWATIFLWSTTVLFFVVMLRRQQARTAAAANEASRRVEVQRGLEKATWQALLAYFTFNHSEDEQKEPKGDAADIGEGTTTTNDEAPQGSAHPDIMEKGLARIDSSEWVTTGTCIICLGEYRLGDRLCRMPCRHVFHAKCIDEWLNRAKEPCCPMCKKDLRGEKSASSSSANTVGSEPSGEGVLMDDTAGIEEV